VAAFAIITVAAVSCSSESSRFENPFSSKSTPASSEVTGSVASKPASAVQSKQLPAPPQASAMKPPASRPAVTPTAGGSPGMATYTPNSGRDEIVTGSVPAAAATAKPAWNWEGGTPIMVAPGETAATLAQRYGVPVSAIVQANNLPDAAAVKPGQRLVIPRFEATSSASPRQTAAAPTPAKPAPAIAAPATASGPLVHTVAPGETLSSLSRKYKKSVAEIAKANKIEPHTLVKMGDRIIIPGMRAPQTAAPAAPPAAPAPVVAQPQPKAPATTPSQKVAGTPPASTARTVTPAPEQPTQKTSVDATAGVMPTFRWPVRGRVIAGFGPKTTGQQNDGINVAVPEGTPIKAAEDGVVAYAGNELKTYGNLVLIRHSNGYVTAYAHASEILVKRDEPIKRGQVIAKSGQTGNVSAPQLHFEIRKGSSPVDPMPYLDKGGSL
jgi:murein DD-endopeptidase MepM/ murein hydrolase activator NlpD